MIKFQSVVIDSIATYLPDEYLTSDQIEDQLSDLYARLKLPHGRLEMMSGIKSRGIWSTGTRPSHLSTQAAKKALEKGQINHDQIDLLIHSSVCRDFLEPATASVIHNNLKLPPTCNFFDLSNACLGFINAMIVAANMIESKMISSALIVSGENSGPLLLNTIKVLQNDQTITRQSIKKYFANLTIGSGAVAYVLTHKDLSSSKIKLSHVVSLTDSEASTLCQGSGNINELTMETDSEALMQRGIILAKKTWSQFYSNFKADAVLTHQVGTAHETLLLKELSLTHLPTTRTYPHLGNTGSAALPLTFAKFLDDNQAQDIHNVALLGIGSGLSCSMVGVTI